MGLESGVQGGCVWTLRDTRSLGFNGHDVSERKCWVEVAQEVVAMERLKGEQRARELPRSESVLAFLSAFEVTLYSSLKGVDQLATRKPSKC